MMHFGCSLTQVIAASSPVFNLKFGTLLPILRDFVHFAEKHVTHLHLHFSVCKNRDKNKY